MDSSELSSVIFPKRLLSAGSVHDELYETKAIKRVGYVDLGTLNWTYSLVQKTFSTYDYKSDIVSGNRYNIPNIICGKYNVRDAYNHEYYIKEITLGNTGWFVNSSFVIKDFNYTNITTFKAAMSGIYAYYELTTPIEYELDTPLDMSYRVDDFGTESVMSTNVLILIQLSKLNTLLGRDVHRAGMTA